MYAYIDESACLADPNKFFIIGVVSSESPKKLRRILKKARRIMLGKRSRLLPEIKYNRVSERVALFVMEKLVQSEISIYAWIIDKEGRKIDDSPENYGLVLAYVLKYGYELAGWRKVWIDRKYIKNRNKQLLNKTLTNVLGNKILKSYEINFDKSENQPGIGIADFVAGSFHAAYNQGNNKFVEVLRSKVVMEERVLWREIKQKAIAPKGPVGLRSS